MSSIQENRAAWVAALRSGNYEQGRGSLQTDNNRYCCLGVACRVAEAAGVAVATLADGELRGLDLRRQSAVNRWLDVGPGLQTVLIDMNDTDKRSFDEIADYIEKELTT